MAYDQARHQYAVNPHHSDPGGPHNTTGLDSPPHRHRSPSIARTGLTMPEHNKYAPQQKVDEAVTSAVDKASTETTNYPPELIAQITQSVLKQLHSGGPNGSTPIPPQTHFSPPPQQPVPLSPSTASGTSQTMPNRVFTPPSPFKHSDYPDTTSSTHSQSGHPLEGRHSPQEHRSSIFEPPKRSPSPPGYTSDSSDKPHARPKGPSRLSTGKEETTLERIWGQLFDEDGNPTARLGQFLRGLAMHIIEDYEPKHSLVIPPNKMIKYYEDVRLPHELYPWSVVFDDEHSSISRMFRDLKCQHHLVQERFDERPDIPGLTPIGFERWVTLLIQAHPEEEFVRLQKAVLEMPVNNPDDKKERFPKEISRRLFPGHGDRLTRELIEESICEHAAVSLPQRSNRERSPSQTRKDPSPPRPAAAAESSSHKPNMVDQPYVPQNQRPSVSFDLPPHPAPNPTHEAPKIERERKPYSGTLTGSAIDDTNAPMAPPPNPINIERERKPYSAQPGGGKQFEDDSRKDYVRPRSESVTAPIPKPGRSDSTARARPIPINGSRPMDVPKAEVHHHRAPSNATRRRRSPSFSRGTTNDFRRSEGEFRGYQPAPYQSSAPVTGGMPLAEAVFDENETRRYFEKNARDRIRRQADEDARSYGESPRRHEPKRGDYANDEDYYRAGGRGGVNGYDYAQPYGGPVYR